MEYGCHFVTTYEPLFVIVLPPPPAGHLSADDRVFSCRYARYHSAATCTIFNRLPRFCCMYINIKHPHYKFDKSSDVGVSYPFYFTRNRRCILSVLVESGRLSSRIGSTSYRPLSSSGTQLSSGKSSLLKSMRLVLSKPATSLVVCRSFVSLTLFRRYMSTSGWNLYPLQCGSSNS